ncbi:PREDICTED: uncharacterized protein LOC18598923 isoform X2 [Theobroma cacao]|uniref:Uncharacterized protein LOC18598923 isoform X2 n=1 Tax=Theobroma cacao TaxID=3641 RepID=A0AB32WI91_THECC|nr:PREDICTED: uncharacterized protein LOC18598923 isoform X2 [Theobroma cacao]
MNETLQSLGLRFSLGYLAIGLTQRVEQLFRRRAGKGEGWNSFYYNGCWKSSLFCSSIDIQRSERSKRILMQTVKSQCRQAQS